MTQVKKCCFVLLLLFYSGANSAGSQPGLDHELFLQFLRKKICFAIHAGELT